MTKENRGTLAAFATYVTSNILGMVGLSCYILADTFFVARGCGAAGLTALNLALPAYSLMHGLGLMTGMGGATRYAIAQAGDRTARQNVFSHALCLSALMSAPFLAAGLTAPAPSRRPARSRWGGDRDDSGISAHDPALCSRLFSE